MTKPRAVVPFSRTNAMTINRMFGSTPTTTALPLLPAAALHTDAWHEARRGGVGASELGAIIGAAGAHQSPFSIWWAKVGNWHIAETEEMLMGLDLEDVISTTWRFRHPESFVARPASALYAANTLPLCLMCTPDFLTVRCGRGDHAVDDHDVWGADFGEVGSHVCEPVIEPLECKAYEGGDWGQPETDEVPEHIKVQVWVQCFIFGAKRGHVARMAGKKITSYVIDLTDEAKARVLAGEREALNFLASIARGEHPPIDASPATAEALAAMYADIDPDGIEWFTQSEVDAYREALDSMAKARYELNLQRNLIRSRLGRNMRGVTPNGESFVERQVYKRRAYSVKAALVDKLQPKGRR